MANKAATDGDIALGSCFLLDALCGEPLATDLGTESRG